jgi:hypothetical protein
MDNAKNKSSKRHQDEIRAVSQKLKEQMILANATQKHKAFEAVLKLVFEADRTSIEYLNTFHSVLGVALQHTSLYSERVNVDMKRTRLLKRALYELVDEDTERMHEFSDFGSEKRPRSAHSPSPTNVCLGNSEDERSEPTRRLNSIIEKLSASETEPDVVKNAMRGARRNLRSQHSFGDADNGYDSDFTNRVRNGAVYDTQVAGEAGLAVPSVNAEAHSAQQAESLSKVFAPRITPAVEPVERFGVVGYSDIATTDDNTGESSILVCLCDFLTCAY